MKLVVKTLKGSHFDIKVQPNDTVMAVKKNIEDVQGKDNYPCGQQLLIHNGKVLKDETTLAENKVSGDGFLVVMLSKQSKTSGSAATSSQPSSAAAATATSNPSATPAPEAHTQEPISKAPSGSNEVTTNAPAYTYVQAASHLVAGNHLEPTVQQLLDMGGGNWDRETVIRALHAAYNNPERAVDYLYSGIPPTAEVAEPVAQFPAAPASGTGTGLAAPASGGPNSSPLNMFSQLVFRWSKGEQSAAFATATHSTFQELSDWNAKYREKFGFVFLICASGRSTPEILAELKGRYSNRPIIEFEIAAQEQMKITELRLAKLFSAKSTPSGDALQSATTAIEKAGDRISKIGTHLAPAASGEGSQNSTRTRPPITTHILDIARGCPASGVEVHLERWVGKQPRPHFGKDDADGWMLLGTSKTDKDGRSGQLMSIVDAIPPGLYRISFNTGEYNPTGFYPFVTVAFEIRESQKLDHFHVPLLVSPFSFSTYRGS